MDEKKNTNSIIYKTFDTPASSFFAKTSAHSAKHKGSYGIFADAVQHREICESLVP